MHSRTKATASSFSLLLLLAVTGTNALPAASSPEAVNLETAARLLPRDDPLSDPLWQTNIWALLPQAPDQAAPPSLNFEVKTDDKGQSILEQAISFTGIPADAHDCELWWARPLISSKANMDFTGTGDVLITPFKGGQKTPSDNAVSYNNVQSMLDDRSQAWYAKFTAADDLSHSWYLTRRGLTCYPQMWFKLQSSPGSQGYQRVFLQKQNGPQPTGFFLRYQLKP